jgi:DNA-binding MarR family transcriptional regulator
LTVKGKSELIEQILRLQMQLKRLMKEDSPDAWLDLNLTIAQLKSLFFINYESETNVKNLASALKVTPPNVTGILDRLVENELVSREYNQLNRREQIVKLTPKGKDLVNRLHERMVVRHSSMLERLANEDLEALATGLTALTRAAREHTEASLKKVEQKEFSTDTNSPVKI